MTHSILNIYALCNSTSDTLTGGLLSANAIQTQSEVVPDLKGFYILVFWYCFGGNSHFYVSLGCESYIQLFQKDTGKSSIEFCIAKCLR